MQTTVQPILQELVSLRHQHPHPHPHPDDPEAVIGDFELPLEALRLLVSPEDIQDAISLVLETDPLTSLFNYELGRIKPPPPPPPPKPKPSKKKGAKAPKPAEPAALDVAPGFRAPRTRRALAAAAAFEAEAAGGAVVEQVQEAVVEETAKKHAKPRTTGQPELVEDVDSQGSFKMFDAGWILPTGQKRGGRQAVERQLLPPPKKRMRTGAYRNPFPFLAGLLSVSSERGTSNLSTISTTASENQTIQETVPPGQVAGPSGLTVEEKAEVDVAMVVEQPEVEPEPVVALPLPAHEPISEPVPEPAPQPEHIPIPVPVPVPETVPAPVPVYHPVPEPVLEPVPERALEPAPEPAPEPIPEPVPELAPEPVPELVSEPAPEPAPQIAVEPAVEPSPQPAPELAPQIALRPPEPSLQPAPELAPQIALGPPVEPSPQPAPELAPQIAFGPLVEPSPQPAPELAPQVSLKPAVEPGPQPAPELAPQIALKPAVEPNRQPAPELALEPVPEPEPEAELVPEVHEKTQAELEARIAAIPRDRYTNIFAMDGKIIIEELDTPATRREKASRRKAEKKAAAAAAVAVTVVAQQQAQPSTRGKGDGCDSDLSSLSELESEEEGGDEAGAKERHVNVHPPGPPIAVPTSALPPAEPGVVILPEGRTLEGGTLGECGPLSLMYPVQRFVPLVWAKAGSSHSFLKLHGF